MASCSTTSEDDTSADHVTSRDSESKGDKPEGEKRKDEDGGQDKQFLPNRAKLLGFLGWSLPLIKRPSEVVEKKSYDIVDRDAQLEPALAKLRERGETVPLLAIDCEAENLSRSGELCVVSVATESSTYLFDIKALGAKAFDRGLRDLLEDPSREKLMFDCRGDADCLWHQFRVKLANVLDLQLMQVIYRESHPEPERTNFRPRSPRNCIKDVPRVRGLLFCLETYVKDEKLIKAKKEGKEIMDGWSWMTPKWIDRPLDQRLLNYAAADVSAFFALYQAIKQCVDDSGNMARLKEASQKYLDFFRSREERTLDEFEKNSFLPWRILPPYAGSSYRCDVMCVGCKRRFPRSDFSNIQLRKGVPKCPVCKRVKEEIDIENVRAKEAEKEAETWYCYSDDDDGY